MRPLRTVAVLPTMFTLGNVVCGFFAIVVAANLERPGDEVFVLGPQESRHLLISGWLIFLAMVFDALDGQVARLAKTTSDFGAQLDSLCDLVTFGVAPAFLLVKMCPRFEYLHREAVWIIAASFVACAAMRLARFNVETSDADEDHMHFSGLPTPAAAAAVAGFAILFNALRKADNPIVYARQIDLAMQTALPVLGVVLALLMVSRIPYPHIVNQVFRGQRSFGHVVAILFAVVALTAIRDMRGYVVAIVCCGFVLIGPARFAWDKLLRRGKEKESFF